MKFSRAATFFPPSKLQIAGREVVLNIPDQHGIRVAFVDLLLDDCYQCEKWCGENQNINNIIDIGANVGIFGLVARQKFPLAKIHAYEPNILLKPYLETQAKAIKMTVFMEGVGKESGRMRLTLHDDSVQTRSESDQNGEIRMTSFADAIGRIGGKVDLLKIDCEGAEWELFEDSSSWQKIQRVAMEYHLWPSHSHLEVRARIEELGFRVHEQKPSENYGLLIASR